MIFKNGTHNIAFSMSKKTFAAILIFAVCAAGGSIFLYYNSPFEKSIFPPCILRTYFHLYCPGCGATRATYEILHGNIIAAFHYNPLYIISLPFMLFLFMEIMGITINGKPILPKLNLSLKNVILLIFIIFAYWILRNVPGYPFTLLRP